MTIFDHVGLGGGEDKFSVCDVHLASAEIHRINPTLHGANNVLGFILACQQISIGHARHRDVLVTFAAPVARVGHSHQSCRKLVTEVSL